MREIKFRAWDSDCKEMFDWDYLKNYQSKWLDHKDGSPEFKPMQYTGLKDKNGVEIYEGDIIQSTWRPQDRFVIEWDDLNGEWVFCSDTNETGGKYKGSIVIGTIYQNPELLNINKDTMNLSTQKLLNQIVEMTMDDMFGEGLLDDDLSDMYQDGDKQSQAIDAIIKYLNEQRGE